MITHIIQTSDPLPEGIISIGGGVFGRAIEDSHSECRICQGQRRSDDPYTGPCRLCGGRMESNICRVEFINPLAESDNPHNEYVGNYLGGNGDD